VIKLGADGYEEHEPVLDLKPPNGFKMQQPSGTMAYALAVLKKGGGGESKEIDVGQRRTIAGSPWIWQTRTKSMIRQ
jgi:hypothetical protein